MAHFDLYPLFEHGDAQATDAAAGRAGAASRLAQADSAVRRSFSASAATPAHRSSRTKQSSYLSACDVLGTRCKGHCALDVRLIRVHLGTSLYVGTSDGLVRRYRMSTSGAVTTISILDSTAQSCLRAAADVLHLKGKQQQQQTHELLGQISIPGQKVIESITVLPSTGIVAVLSDTLVHFVNPDLQPSAIAPIRGITAVCRDAAVATTAEPAVKSRSGYSTGAVCVDRLSIAKRRVIQCLEVHRDLAQDDAQLVVEKVQSNQPQHWLSLTHVHVVRIFRTWTARW